jgi:arylsulfatase A-like enzyme
MPRSRRPFATWIALAAALATATLACSRQEPRAKHLLLITVDTLRTDRLGAYGGPNRPSPAIDELIQGGLRCDAAYVPRGMTLSSMATFFTSRYPADHGVVDNTKVIPERESTLAERLAEQGFRTRAFSASGVLDPARQNRIDQGFAPNAFVMIYDDALLAKKAASFVRDRFGRDDRREFTWVHFMAPHKPYATPPDLVEKLDPGYAGAFALGPDDLDAALEKVYVEKRPFGGPDKRHVEAIYDGEIVLVDDGVRRILEALKESGQERDTLVVFAADHGEDLGSHFEYFYHANSPYRATTRIPLAFRQHGTIKSQRVVGDVIESVDLLPTALSWLGIDDDENAPAMRGRDLTPLLLGSGEVAPRVAFARIDECAATERGLGIVAVRDRDFSLVWNDDGYCPAHPPTAGDYPIPPLALYDLRGDPDEQVDVKGAHPDVVARLQQAAREIVGSLTFDAAPEATYSAIEFEQLGYVAGGKEAKRRRCGP